MLHLVFRAGAANARQCRVGLRSDCSSTSLWSILSTLAAAANPCTSSRSTIARKFRFRVVRQRLVACYASALHLEQARPGAMSSRVFGSAVAPALFAAVFLALCFHQCSCQQVFTLGGATGWTDAVTNVNYTQYMAAVQFKAGDTLCFYNTDTVNHDVLQVYTQSDYDNCNVDNVTGWPINPGDLYNLTFPDPEYRVWIFDSQYCTVGLKVEFPVLNVDGTAVPEPSSTADPPSLNAPIPDPESPPPPPDAPLAEAGGPTTNAATSQAPAHWTLLAIAVAACFLRF